MKRFVAGLFVAAGALMALAMPGASQQGKNESKARPPVVIAAAATSYGEGSSSVVCLLDENCQGFWTPMSKDGGVNEGIYIQFREPVAIEDIVVVVEGAVKKTLLLKPYFDGMTGSDIATQKFRQTKAGQDDARREAIRRENEKQWGDIDVPYDTPVDGSSDQGYDGDRIFVDSLYDAEADRTHFKISHNRADYRIKSFFLKIDASLAPVPPRISSIRFASTRLADDAGHWTPAMGDWKKMELPGSVKATVTATSVLNPAIAYGPEHLFDSQIDMAWATDGGKTNGSGESVTVAFEEKQTVQGLMIWNGYQRSEAHYKANGRVRTLTVNGEAVVLKDVPGMQEQRLAKPVEAERITLAIKDIYKGAAYKDVLISELRFLTPDGRIILPQVVEKQATLPEWASPLQDSTYASFIQMAYMPDDAPEYISNSCGNTSLRVRSNGSFVIYADFLDGVRAAGSFYEPGVIEGNWEIGPDKNSLRLFGKKYRVPGAEEASYLSLSRDMKSLPGPRIFQSRMTVARFNELSETEQRGILSFLVNRRFVKPAPKNKSAATTIALNLRAQEASNLVFQDLGGDVLEGKTLDAAVALLLDKARGLNPLLVKSDVYTDLLLPQEKVIKCAY